MAIIAVGSLLAAWLLLEPHAVPADSRTRARLNDSQKIELLISRLEQAALYSRSDAFLGELDDGFSSSRGPGDVARASEIVRGFFDGLRPLGSDPLMILGAPEVQVDGNTALVQVQILLSGCCMGGDAVRGLSNTTLRLEKRGGAWKVSESDDLMGLMVAARVAQKPGLAPKYARCWETVTLPAGHNAH